MSAAADVCPANQPRQTLCFCSKAASHRATMLGLRVSSQAPSRSKTPRRALQRLTLCETLANEPGRNQPAKKLPFLSSLQIRMSSKKKKKKKQKLGCITCTPKIFIWSTLLWFYFRENSKLPIGKWMWNFYGWKSVLQVNTRMHNQSGKYPFHSVFYLWQ